MTKKELQAAYEKIMSGKAKLIDVRTKEERKEQGFEPKALHMDYGLFAEGKLPNLPKDTTIYVHCRSGGRAGVIAHVLQSHGFKNSFNLGGFDDWVKLTK